MKILELVNCWGQLLEQLFGAPGGAGAVLLILRFQLLGVCFRRVGVRTVLKIQRRVSSFRHSACAAGWVLPVAAAINCSTCSHQGDTGILPILVLPPRAGAFDTPLKMWFRPHADRWGRHTPAHAQLMAKHDVRAMHG